MFFILILLVWPYKVEAWFYLDSEVCVGYRYLGSFLNLTVSMATNMFLFLVQR